jgi:hypothetical protein
MKHVEKKAHDYRSALLNEVELLEQRDAELRQELSDVVARLSRAREQLKAVLP